MKVGPERLAFFGAVLALLAGYLFVFRPFEASIADRFGQLDDGRALLERRLAVARRASQLGEERHALTRWIEGVGLHDDRTTIVNRFLRRIATAAAGENLRITAVAADNIAPAPALSARAASSARPVAPVVFDELPMTVSLRGDYRRILRLVRDVNRADVAARIGIDSLGSIDRNATHDPELRATLHVTLLRAPLPGAGSHASV